MLSSYLFHCDDTLKNFWVDSYCLDNFLIILIVTVPVISRANWQIINDIFTPAVASPGSQDAGKHTWVAMCIESTSSPSVCLGWELERALLFKQGRVDIVTVSAKFMKWNFQLLVNWIFSPWKAMSCPNKRQENPVNMAVLILPAEKLA